MERYMEEPGSSVKGGRAGARFRLLLILGLAAAYVIPPNTLSAQDVDPELRSRVEASISVLAHDSLHGRGTGTEGSRKAATFIADRLASFGVEPAVDGAYLQRVPLVRHPDGAFGLDQAGVDGGSAGAEVEAYNVIGLVRGTHPDRGEEVVVVGAHFDHLGIRPESANAAGDSIFNGADDDASGVVAVLEAARSLAEGPPPDRTVVFFFSTGEELGLLGTRWYLLDPILPLERTVANLQVEMIGRPDPEAGGTGRVWLTGYERSTMGSILTMAGLPVVPDPRPDQNFFFRSDNIAFAMEGIPAHTLSSYGMHADYHTPDDEVESLDMDHFARSVTAVVGAVQALARDEAPEWVPGGRPEAPRP